MSISPSALSSVLKKQIVAVTGLGLIFFVFTHLAGNLFIYGGPHMYNTYAKTLHSLGLLLLLARVGLVLTFFTHIYFTYLVILENIQARGGHARYAVEQSVGTRNAATKLMPFTGTFLFAYLIWHLFDFAFVNQHGALALIHGINYGLYGVVVNSLSNPFNAAFYILAILCLGFHLMHGIASVVQTFGFNHPFWSPIIKRFALYVSAVLAGTFCSIPIHIILLGLK